MIPSFTIFCRFGRPLLTIAAVMTILIMIVGICGNLLTIVALVKCPKVRNVAAAFIIRFVCVGSELTYYSLLNFFRVPPHSLCVADCIFCVLVLPFNALRYIQGTWTHGDLLCRLVPFVQYGNVGVSLLCIAMITINRLVLASKNACLNGNIYIYINLTSHTGT